MRLWRIRIPLRGRGLRASLRGPSAQAVPLFLLAFCLGCLTEKIEQGSHFLFFQTCRKIDPIWHNIFLICPLQCPGPHPAFQRNLGPPCRSSISTLRRQQNPQLRCSSKYNATQAIIDRLTTQVILKVLSHDSGARVQLWNIVISYMVIIGKLCKVKEFNKEISDSPVFSFENHIPTHTYTHNTITQLTLLSKSLGYSRTESAGTAGWHTRVRSLQKPASNCLLESPALILT